VFDQVFRWVLDGCLFVCFFSLYICVYVCCMFITAIEKKKQTTETSVDPLPSTPQREKKDI